jgi:hypothetical protein
VNEEIGEQLLWSAERTEEEEGQTTARRLWRRGSEARLVKRVTMRTRWRMHGHSQCYSR